MAAREQPATKFNQEAGVGTKCAERGGASSGSGRHVRRAQGPATFLGFGRDARSPKKPLSMRIWIDADAAPREMKDVVYRAARRLEIETILVANRRLQVPPGTRFVHAVKVEGGPDEADRYIAEHASAGDVAVTADIPLASLLIPKQVHVIDPRGEPYTSENIGERLGVRNFMDAMRGAGLDIGGAKPYGPKDKQKFADSLDRLLTRRLRRL
jgi:uncharacterized protein